MERAGFKAPIESEVRCPQRLTEEVMAASEGEELARL